MKILIIVQDLRVSGTSEGLVSRSFIGTLSHLHPNAVLDIHYFMYYELSIVYCHLLLKITHSLELKFLIHYVLRINYYVWVVMYELLIPIDYSLFSSASEVVAENNQSLILKNKSKVTYVIPWNADQFLLTIDFNYCCIDYVLCIRW